jgi:hypothetical protein
MAIQSIRWSVRSLNYPMCQTVTLGGTDISMALLHLDVRYTNLPVRPMKFPGFADQGRSFRSARF